MHAGAGAAGDDDDRNDDDDDGDDGDGGDDDADDDHLDVSALEISEKVPRPPGPLDETRTDDFVCSCWFAVATVCQPLLRFAHALVAFSRSG